MSVTTAPLVLPSNDSAPVAAVDVSTQVWNLLTTLYPQNRHLERRRAQRYPFPHLIRLTPISAQGISLNEERIVVTGKNVSESGICFYHAGPLAARRAILSLETGQGQWVSFLTDLTWCRFTHHGWYESGGVFLQAIANPAGIVR